MTEASGLERELVEALRTWWKLDWRSAVIAKARRCDGVRPDLVCMSEREQIVAYIKAKEAQWREADRVQDAEREASGALHDLWQEIKAGKHLSSTPDSATEARPEPELARVRLPGRP